MILRPAPVSTDRFTYIAARNEFVADASDLPQLARVFDDACDVGLTLVSAKTGREVVFAVKHEERDREGDLLWLELGPATTHRHFYGTVRIFND